jgi:hypothetical protein
MPIQDLEQAFYSGELHAVDVAAEELFFGC